MSSGAPSQSYGACAAAGEGTRRTRGLYGARCCAACCASDPGVCGRDVEGESESLAKSSGANDANDSSASANKRPIAESGFDIVSLVFCSRRRASSLNACVGTGSVRGCADSSPVWDDGGGRVMGRPAGFGLSINGVPGEGVCGAVDGRLWIASSTFLKRYLRECKCWFNEDHTSRTLLE